MDLTLLDDNAAATKSIISGKRSWIFSRKKSVRFSVHNNAASSVKSTNIDEKWRKYVQQQFKTLKKHKRNRWLGRGKKRARKQEKNSSARDSSSEQGAGPSLANELDDTNSDVLPTFQLPLPDHKKRKKAKPRSTSKTSNKRQTTKNNNRSVTRKKRTQGQQPPSSSPRSSSQQRPRQQQQQQQGGKEGGEGVEEEEGYEELLPSLKRPLNAFILFSKACRQEFHHLLVPAFESKVVAMVLGHIWRYLSKQERKSFYDEAEKSRQLFQEEKRKRQQLISPEQNTGEGRGMDRTGIKRPLNGFMLFCQEHRALLDPGLKGFSGSRRFVCQMSKKWHHMKPKEKLTYVTRAEEERKVYQGKIHSKAEDRELAGCLRAKDNEGEGDFVPGGAGLKTGSSKPQVSEKKGRNNNMWMAESSDTDGSQPTSASQVEISTVGGAFGTPLASPEAGPHVNTQPLPTSTNAGHNPCKSCNDTNLSEDMKEQSQKMAQPANGPPPGTNPQASCPPSAEGGSSQDEERRARRKKKKSRVRRSKRHISWRDEVPPWDVFNPVTSALCDEDICTRLYPMSRDDSYLRTGSASCQQGGHGTCPHQPDYSPRSCVSCLSLNSLKKKVEMAFQKPEMELANVSSSLSSLGNLCPQACLSNSLSLCSDNSSLQHLLNDCHLSDHENLNASFRKSYISHPLSWQYNQNQSYISTSCDPLKKKPVLSSSTNLLDALHNINAVKWNSVTPGSKNKMVVSHLMSVANHSSARKKPSSASEQPRKGRQEEERVSSYSGKTRLLSNKGKSSKWSSEKTHLAYRTHVGRTRLDPNTQTSQLELHKSRSSYHPPCSNIRETFPSAAPCKGTSLNRFQHKGCSSMDSGEQTRSTQFEISIDSADWELVGEQAQLNKKSDDSVSDKLSSKATAQMDAEAVKDHMEVLNEMPKSTSTTSESKKEHDPKLGLSMDISTTDGNKTYGDQLQTSRLETLHQMQTPTSILSTNKNRHSPMAGLSLQTSLPTKNTKHEDQQQAFRPVTPASGDKVCCTKDGDDQVTNHHISVHNPNRLAAHTPTQIQMKETNSIILHSSRYLKRRVSFDSLEAMNSTNKFPVSRRSMYSVLKFPFAIQEGQRTKASECVQNGRDAAVARKRSQYNSAMMHNLLPEDLELEYCQRKSWI